MTGDIAENKISLKSIYFWNMAGSFSNALSSVVLLMVVARVMSRGDGDVFTLAWAIAQMMLTIGKFEVRVFQATDIVGSYKFRQYLRFRILTIILMLVSTLVYSGIRGFDFYRTTIVMLVCLVKVMDAASDVFQGGFQQKERLDLSGKCLTYRVFISNIAFGITIFLTRDLFISCLVMWIVSMICFVMFDVRFSLKFPDMLKLRQKEQGYAWMFSLLKSCLPLFINTFLLASIFNAPRMAIDNAIDSGILEQGRQVYYGILFMPAAVLNLSFLAFRPLITQMAIQLQEGNSSFYFKSIRKIYAYLMIMSVLILTGGWLVGTPVLSVVYNINFSGYTTVLLILLVGGVVNTFANVLNHALTVIRRQRTLLIAYLITWGYAQYFSPILVTRSGLLGGAVTFASSMLLLLAVTLVLFIISVRKVFPGSIGKFAL